MARLIETLDVEVVRAQVARVRSEIGDGVRLLAAVKYVPLDQIGVLRDAGLELLGENRAQDLEDKAAAFPEFEWHFIGQLQSRKVRQIVPHARLIHSVASESALRQLERHAQGSGVEILIEVNVAGEEAKAGIQPGELTRYLEASPVPVAGLMTMPPYAEDPEASRPHFAALRELAARHRLRELSMGTSQDYRVAVEEGATIVRLGSVLYEG